MLRHEVTTKRKWQRQMMKGCEDQLHCSVFVCECTGFLLTEAFIKLTSIERYCGLDFKYHVRFYNGCDEFGVRLKENRMRA